ncbi:MAG: segregation and condensation protein, partial [Streptomycetaceae bacterium]|nr:segregation and condensation protein [Streptomycetaceae bacterium]
RGRALGSGPAARSAGEAVVTGETDSAAVPSADAPGEGVVGVASDPPVAAAGPAGVTSAVVTGEGDSGPVPSAGAPGEGALDEAVARGLDGGGAEAVASGDVPRTQETRQRPGAAVSGPAAEEAAGANGRFTVRLVNFEGPFDLLLQLISKHKLDVTEIALSKVTDEFMSHIRAMGAEWDLDQATEFLVVAATLLDLKAARLLPAAEVEDEEDLALLEARDLLFARLLQYRAYKQVAAIFADRLEAEGRRYPRTVGLEPQHAELLPEVVLSIGPERFAQLAVKAMQPKPKPQVYVDHIHAPLVSVREQAEHVIAILRERGAASFGELTADAPDTLTVVARFLALLELYREKVVALDQEEALGTLQVRWTGGGEEDRTQPLVTDEFDQEAKPEKQQKGGAER